MVHRNENTPNTPNVRRERTYAGLLACCSDDDDGQTLSLATFLSWTLVEVLIFEKYKYGVYIYT